MEENKQLQQLNARSGGFYYAITIALYVLISFLGQALMSALAEKTSTVYLAVCSTFSIISFAIVLAYTIFYCKTNITSITGESKGVKFIPPALLLSIGMLLGLGYVNDAIANLFKGWGLNVSSLSVPLDTVGQFVLFSVILAVLPAVFEELFFRGLILNSLNGIKRVYAVLISALCFALYHGSVAQLVYQFIYGVALGFLFVTAKSILPCVVAHFINNFAVLLLNFLKVNLDLYSLWIIALGVFCLAVFSAIIFLVLRKNKEEIEEKTDSLKNFLFPSAIFAFLVCISLAIGSLVG